MVYRPAESLISRQNTMSHHKQHAPRSDSKLLQACLDGNLAVVRERIEAGANVDAGRKDKHPPLEIAARCGHLSIVRELISHGADVNQIYKVNFEAFPTSPLIGAVTRHRFQVAEELVSAGASTALETHPGWNAASQAAFKAIEYWWLSNDAKTSFKELASLTSSFKRMARLTKENRQPQTFQDWFGFLKKAVGSGAKVNDYCLWEACKLGCLPVLQYLISIGANVNFAPPSRSMLIPSSSSALQMAIGNEFDEVALLLISAGADPNLKCGFCESPLELAVAKERHSVIRALLAAGATPR
jgi:ankyrin repeat protein